MTAHKRENIITVLWKKGIPFASWKFPGQKEVQLAIQLSPQAHTFDFKSVEEVSGFVIAPFESAENQKAYVLKPDMFFDTLPDIGEIDRLPEFPFNEGNSLVNQCRDRQTYLKKAEQAITDLKNDRLKKVVLSRVIEKKPKKDFDPGISFALLNERYDHSFNYIFYLPELGSWLGATPEMFLNVGEVHAETMSLAGTKPAGQVRWSPKEEEEQAIVTEFIRKQLDDMQIKEYETEGPQTLMAGNVGHLATKFRIPVGELQGRTGELIRHLHPTPAVCGMPKDAAYRYIRKIEDHSRKCYSGFLGPWNLEGASRLFVNLRCAAFDREKLHLYVGGGLTSSSVAEAEWEETEHKSKTLLSVLENF